MVDPVTAIAAATSAFSLIKKGFDAGRDIESMYSDMGRWMGAVSDIRHADQMNKNPSVFKKLFNGSSIEQEAMDIFAAKKKAEEMEQELRTYVNLVYGPNSWADIIKLQGQIRRDRQKQIYAQQELRRNIINTIGVILGAVVGVVAFSFIVYLIVLGLKV
tara:strand:+ start:126 stop:605 length:480 start_codon:yes stop_codon:yes gene_type:complete